MVSQIIAFGLADKRKKMVQELIDLWDKPPIEGMQLWFDASQITGLSDGDSVTTWPDLSGNSYDAVCGNATKPLYKTNIINSLPIIRFNRANIQYFDIAGAVGVLRNTTGGTMFCVYQETLINNIQYPFSFSSNTATSVRLGFRISDNLISMAGRTLDEDTMINTVGVVNTAFKVNTVIADCTNGILTHYMNQQRIGYSTLLTKGSFSDTDSVAVQIGALGGTAVFGGDIAEILVFNRALSAIERAIIEQYLCVKYNILTGVAV